jgi:type VII secretion-associated serine protease mycosin
MRLLALVALAAAVAPAPTPSVAPGPSVTAVVQATASPSRAAPSPSPAAPASPSTSAPPSPDPIRQNQWYLDFLHIDQVHQITRGAGVTVALIDTGVDASHPDLAGSILPGTDFGPLKSDGRKDVFGHGTAMAGLIAGHGRILGIAPEAKILPVKPVFTNDNGGVADTEEPIRWAVDHGAQVISMSIGDDAPTPAWGRAIQYALSKDVVVVAAVSNKGQGTHPTGLAMAPGVVVVSGVDQTGKFDPISLTGDVVTVAAPSRDCWSTRIGGGYGGSTGTSNSAAITSGVVALIRSRFPDFDGPAVVRRLTATAHDEGADGRDPLYGFGVIDPLRALTATLPSETSPATATTGASPSPSAQAEEPPPGHPLWMIFAVAGGALAVAVGLALIGRLRR